MAAGSYQLCANGNALLTADGKRKLCGCDSLIIGPCSHCASPPGAVISIIAGCGVNGARVATMPMPHDTLDGCSTYTHYFDANTWVRVGIPYIWFHDATKVPTDVIVGHAVSGYAHCQGPPPIPPLYQASLIYHGDNVSAQWGAGWDLSTCVWGVSL
jgi:hypothetical protein